MKYLLPFFLLLSTCHYFPVKNVKAVSYSSLIEVTHV